ncbi:PRC-barrel domain-containing protein [Methanothermobacter sp.]|uniref:PRC-barrel domain-containing protein n=1 Tax=Methanothermobacter sp. TaxID=1884223 RepID=UPI002626A585|nr:PRC-barrel domain-containing protein [Methanothermobacter sp.]MDI9618465.1 PRC-barrel domain-containing protein [Methanothermobacter sp.]
MEEKKLIKGEEKYWSEIKGYQVATNNARILGELEELIINDKTGKITDVVIKIDSGRNVTVKGAKRKGDYLLVPFGKVEKVGEFIIISE